MILVPGLVPLSINKLLSTHPHARTRLKRKQYELLAVYGRDVPRATGKRRVSLEIGLGPRMRAADPDNVWKGILDGLRACGLVRDDNRQGVELGPVTFARGKEPWVRVILEDLA